MAKELMLGSSSVGELLKGGRLLVTGMPRSGTGFMAETLRQAGVEAGHEKVYKPCHVFGCAQVRWRQYEAEVSWLAMPVLEQSGHPGPVRVQIRHPYDVIDSIGRAGWFGFQANRERSTNAALVAMVASEVFTRPNPVARAAHFVSFWPWFAGDYPIHRVEDVQSAVRKNFNGPQISPKQADWDREKAHARIVSQIPADVLGRIRERYGPWYPDL